MKHKLPRTKKVKSLGLLIAGLFVLLFSNTTNAQTASAYTFAAASGTYSAIAGTTIHAAAVDDACVSAIPIGFTFNYCCNNFTTVSVSSNGWLSFNTTTASNASNALATNTIGNVVAPLWDDLQVFTGGAVTYTTTGTAPNRVFTVQWSTMEWYYTTSLDVISFQVKLYETSNRIEFIYKQGAGAVSGASASIGISGPVTGDYLSLNSTGAAPTASSTTETTTLATKPANGQIYRFTPGAVCSGTPAPGNTVASVNPVCSSAPFTLSMSGSATGCGMSYQWQSSTNGTTWNNIAGATSVTYAATQTAATYYRCVVTCANSGLSANSTSVYVTMNTNAAACYCTNTNTTSTSYYISNFTATGATTINNTTGFSASGYGNYTAMTVTQMQSQTITFSVTETGGTMHFGIWVDWNDNGSFADAGEEMYNGNGTYATTATGSFTVPFTASVGCHRMRVVGNELGTAAACTGSGTTECEDYMVCVTAMPPCTGTPAGGTLNGVPNTTCTGYNLTVTGSTVASALTYQWYSSTSATGPWTPIAGATSDTYTATTTGLYYMRVTTCTASGLTGNSTTLLYNNSLPLNDECANATLITPSATTTCTSTVPGSVSCATASAQTNSCAATGDDDDVWYQFVATTTTHMVNITNVVGAVTDMYFAVYSGTCGALTNIACSDADNTTLTGLTIGQTYYIRVYTYTTTTGQTTTFEICVASVPPPPTQAACTNLGFESGLTGWYGTAGNPLTGATTDPSPIYVPTAFGTTTGTNFNVVTAGTDAYGGFPTVYAGSQSAMLGNTATYETYNAATLEQTFNVTSANTSFTYYYAVVLEDGGHANYEQPFFTVDFFDQNGNPIVCGEYLMVAPGTGYVQSTVNTSVYYKPWSGISVNLSSYVGQTVTIKFMASDCSQGAHFGYCYIDCACADFGIITPATICAGQSATLTAPSGAATYNWSTGATTQAITVNPSVTTTYTCSMTTSGVTPCNFTLTTNVTVFSAASVTATASPATVCPSQTSTLTASGAVSYVWSTGGNTASVNVSPATTTTYTVTATAAGGCTASTTVTVTVSSSAAISAAASPATICNGASSTLTASGGTTYTWNGGSTINPRTVSPTTTTTYTVTGSTGAGCSGTATVTVTVNPLPTVSATATPAAICAGQSSTISASGANSYTWSPSGTGTSFTATPGSTTTYSVTGTSTAGCTGTATVTLTVNPLPTVTATATPAAICAGQNSTIAASGANSYTWSPSGSGASFTASPAATTTYSVTGSTAAGCTGTATVTLTVNPLPTVSSTATPAAICAGQSSTIAASGANSYVWSPSGSGASFTASPATTTTYSVTGTSTAGCTGTATVTLTVNPLPTVSATATPAAICAGQSSTIAASGANSYVWSPSGSGASFTASPASTTTYSVTGTTTAGCTGTTTVTLTVNPMPVVTATAASSSICMGSSTNITAGGANTYNWSTGQIVNPIIVSPTASTTYTVTGTTTAGCTGTATVSVTISPSLTLNATATPAAICLNQSSTIAVTGANTYTWSPAGTGASFTATPTATTTYSVTGTDAWGCTGTTTVTLTVNPLPTVAATATPAAICAGQSSTITATGGNTYTWSPSGTGASFTASPAATTTYSVTGSTAAGCTGTATVTLTVNPLPTVSATATPAVICAGQSSTIAATGANSYTWSPGGSGASFTATPGSTTTYSVTGTTTAGCTGTATVTLTVNPLPTIAATATPAAICAGQSSTITATGGNTYTWSPSGTGASFTASPAATTTYSVTGSSAAGCTGTATVTLTVNPNPTISATAAFGSICFGQLVDTLFVIGGWNYVWSNGSILTTQAVSPATTTTYSVTGTSPFGCTGTASVTVTVNPAPTVTATAALPSICIGSSTNLTASGADTYSWSTGQNLNPITVSPVTTTTYTVTGTTAAGCTGIATVTVNISSSLTINATAMPAAICLNQSSTISASGATSYTWSPAGTGASFTANPTATTTYSVTGSDAWGCTGTTTVTLTVNPLPTVAATATPAAICAGQSSTIAATGANSYVWSPSGSGTSFTANPTSTTTYNVTGTSTAGCTGTATVTLTVNPLPAVTATASPTAVCTGQSSTIAAGGADSYTWSPTGSGASFTATPASTTTYSVTGTTAEGCTGTATVTLTINPLPTVTATATPAAICLNQGSTIAASGANTYTWSPTGSGASFAATPTSTTTYSVTGTTAAGCTGTATVTLTVNPLPTVTATATPAAICIGQSSTIAVAGANTYTWSPSGTGASFTATPTTTTTYSVTGTSAAGCTGTTTVTLTVNPLPNITATASPTTICVGFSSTITGNGGTTYVWDNGQNVASFTESPTTTTAYNVTGTDANNCSNTATVTVTLMPGLTVNVTPDIDDICEGESTTLTASSPGIGVGYSWDTGASSASINVSPTTTSTYSVTGTDAQGCSGTATAIVNVTPLPVVSFIADPLTGCDPMTINFTDQSTGNITIWDWEFGDGGISGLQNPSHTYSAGTYDVTLTVTTAAGCQSTITVGNYITISPKPVAAFTASPAVTTEDNPTITFINQSTGATDHSWNFGDATGATDNTENPVYTYTGNGSYVVTLWVTNAGGCTDSTLMAVVIKPTFTFYLPNTFSPNGDGRNDDLRPFGTGWDTDSYSMRIYSRWGELVFSTTDVNHSWDGLMPDGATEAQQEVYSVIISIKGLDGKDHEYIQAIALIR